MGSAPTTQMVIPSKLTEVSMVLDAVLSRAEAHGFNRQALFAIRLALDEALSNAIRHGNGGDPNRKVTIEFSVNDKQVKVGIRDEGCGFAPESLPDPTLDENLPRPHGRGVMLMNAYMTNVSYGKTGNCVTLIKSRDCTRPFQDN